MQKKTGGLLPPAVCQKTWFCIAASVCAEPPSLREVASALADDGRSPPQAVPTSRIGVNMSSLQEEAVTEGD